MMRLTHEQIVEVAKKYCDLRTLQDGIERDVFEQIKVARVLETWYLAFESVIAK